jgi:hypothetical protein
MAEPIAMDDASFQHQQAGYLDTFYGTLFHPLVTFKAIATMPQSANRFLWYGFVSVLLISAMAPLVKLAALGGDAEDLILTVPISIFFGVSLWCFIGLFVGLWAYAFSGQTRIRTFLTLSGLATLPWLFMASISVLRASFGVYGSLLCFLLSLGVWLWAVFLFAVSLTQTYRMSAEKVVIVLAAPFAMFLVFAGWAIGFLLNLRQLMGA